MMPEISLNVLDVVQNSVTAGADLIKISVDADTTTDHLEIIISDNGKGMSEEQVKAVTDPFFTSRTTRKVGLGVPFFKLASESTGGSFSIVSQEGVGTTVTAVFIISSIDRMPLGDITSTIHTLITLNPSINFIYRYSINGRCFKLDTTELRDILGDVPLDTPEVSQYIKEFLKENKCEVDGDIRI